MKCHRCPVVPSLRKHLLARGLALHHHSAFNAACEKYCQAWHMLSDCCLCVFVQVHANQMIDRLYPSPNTPSQVFIGEIVDSAGLSDPDVSSIISWDARDLHRQITSEPSLSTVDQIRRSQLRWCKRSQSEALANLPPRLCAILPNRLLSLIPMIMSTHYLWSWTHRLCMQSPLLNHTSAAIKNGLHRMGRV